MLQQRLIKRLPYYIYFLTHYRLDFLNIWSIWSISMRPFCEEKISISVLIKSLNISFCADLISSLKIFSSHDVLPLNLLVLYCLTSLHSYTLSTLQNFFFPASFNNLCLTHCFHRLGAHMYKFLPAVVVNEHTSSVQIYKDDSGFKPLWHSILHINPLTHIVSMSL